MSNSSDVPQTGHDAPPDGCAVSSSGPTMIIDEPRRGKTVTTRAFFLQMLSTSSNTDISNTGGSSTGTDDTGAGVGPVSGAGRARIARDAQ